jgi:hypothetical protein
MGLAPGATLATWAAALANSATRARSTARPEASAAARVREIRHSTLPRFTAARIRSRSAASSPAIRQAGELEVEEPVVDGTQFDGERDAGSSAASAAKPVMLRIIAETRRIHATFPALL